MQGGSAPPAAPAEFRPPVQQSANDACSTAQCRHLERGVALFTAGIHVAAGLQAAIHRGRQVGSVAAAAGAAVAAAAVAVAGVGMQQDALESASCRDNHVAYLPPAV